MTLKAINLDLKKISEKRACVNQNNTLLYAYRQRDNNQPTNKMTTQNAAKKLTKAGFTITENNGFIQASKEGCKYVIEYFRNGRSEEITCINVRRPNDNHDSMTDYCAGMWAKNITHAIRLAY